MTGAQTGKLYFNFILRRTCNMKMTFAVIMVLTVIPLP